MKTQLGDGVHPNEDGYKAMGGYWADVISGYLSGKPDVTVTTQKKDVILGDMNGDETVDVYDLIALRKTVLSKKFIYEGDFNRDKEMGVADLVSMQIFLLGGRID